MEVTAVCISLLLTVLLQLDAHGDQHQAEKSDGAFPHVIPNRLQFFEYESISFICQEFNDSIKYRGVRNSEEFIPTCTGSTVTSTVNCTIYNVFERDSGEYWCEAGGGERSSPVNITVTAGSVILESPALPVMEGEAVTLHCRQREITLNETADFYKDGLLICTSCSGQMIIQDVSKSDEGLYKCRICGAGQSPGSWLTVISNSLHEEAGSVILETPVLPVTEGDAVTLLCRIKTLSTNFPCVFYKDGIFIGTSSTGNLSIHNVYKSHEGLYMCNITGIGQSPGIWLTVREPPRESCLCSGHFFHVVLLLRTVFTVVLVPVLLFLVGLLHCGKLTDMKK